MKGRNLGEFEELVLLAVRGLGDEATGSAIQEVIRAPEHWLLQVDTITIILPRRAFADEAAERPFLGAILERMAAEARERSVERPLRDALRIRLRPEAV